jgi:hypothetical protein
VWPSDVKDRNATEICLLTYSFDWKWRQHFPLKCQWTPSTRPHGNTYEQIVPLTGSVCFLPPVRFILGSLLDTEDGGSKF